MAKNKTSKRTLSQRTKDQIAALPPRKRKYAEGRLRGKSKKQAALDAGYSSSVATHVAENVETPDVTDALRNAILDLCPIEKLAKTIVDGLDAIETQSFCNVLGSKIKGKQKIELTHVDKIAWAERRQSAALASRVIGVRSMSPVDVENDKGKGRITVVIDC